MGVALKPLDGVYQEVPTGGTGTIDLGDAVDGPYRSVADAAANGEIASGEQRVWRLVDGDNWEIFLGTYTAGATDTISRDTVRSSSNGGSKINLSGSARVYPIASGVDMAMLDSDGVLQLADGLSFGDETLAEYDEGTWTPTIRGSSTPGAQTYSSQVGRYIRVGSLVTVWFDIVMTAKDGTTAGNAQIGGLPFASSSGSIAGMGPGRHGNINLSSGYTQLGGTLAGNEAVITLNESGDNVAPQILTAAAIGATTVIRGSMTYRTG